MDFLAFLGSALHLNNTQDKKDNSIQNPAPSLINPQPKPSQGPLNNPPKNDFFNIFESFFSLCTESRKDKKPEKKPNPSPAPIQQASPAPIQQAKSGYKTNFVNFKIDEESARNFKILIGQFLETSSNFDSIKPTKDEIEFLNSINQTLITENSDYFKISVEGDKLDLAICAFKKLSEYLNQTKDEMKTTDDIALSCILNYLITESKSQRGIDTKLTHRLVDDTKKDKIIYMQ